MRTSPNTLSFQHAKLALPCSTRIRSPTLHQLTVRQPALTCAGRGRSRCGALAVSATAEYRFPDWDYMWRYLVDRMETVPPQQAVELTSNGKFVLVDVRQSDLYDEAHAEGAVNVPLFQKLDWSKGGWQVLKGVAYVVNGVQPVEANPDFVEEVKKITDTGVGVIMYCEAGGTMQPSTNFMTGKTSRSLKAAYRVLSENLTEDVLHLEGGMFGYFISECPIKGKYNPENAGKTPAAAKAPEGDFINKK